MNSGIVIRGLACTTLLWSLQGSLLLSPAGFSGPGRAAAVEAEEGVEVLTRGPVHEAFAETVVFKPTPGILAPKAPPAAIEELPPDQRPAGDNIAWIPGYWAWDDEGNEFLWVSGVWRNLPPGRQWVPGYWQEVEPNYQWVSGYWADEAVEEVEYLPEPPASVEAGPNIEAPSDNSIWVSGSWLWRENRYGWRPGYWEDGRPDWVWVPAHYVWTRHGYVFVDGYWDYSLDRRGVIFAPVRFAHDYYSRPGYFYRPSIVISLGVFTDHLFLRPRCRHYYFGDYYDPSYRRSGFYASHTYYSGGYGYDPIYAHQRWLHRGDDRWERRRGEDFRFFRENRDERPPHTLAAFERYAAARKDGSRRIDPAFASPLSEVVNRKETAIRFKPVDEAERQKFAGRGREIREFGLKRKEIAKTVTEAPEIKESGKGKGRTEAARVKLPKSPLLSRVTENAAKEDTPPVKPKAAVVTDTTGPEQPNQPGAERKGKETDSRRGKLPFDRRGEKGKAVDEPKTEPGAEPKVQPGRKTDADTPKDLPKRGSGNEPKIEPKREPRTEPNPEPKREPRIEPKRESKVEPKVEPKLEPRTEPKREPRVEPKREARVEPKREPRVEPKREPRVEPKREPKVEQAKREPRIEPRAQPRVEPRREPRVEPRREQPKAQPREQPRAQPREQPKTARQPEPRKDRPQDSSDDKKKKR